MEIMRTPFQSVPLKVIKPHIPYRLFYIKCGRQTKCQTSWSNGVGVKGFR